MTQQKKRKRLGKIGKKRATFVAMFERFGVYVQGGKTYPTILLREIMGIDGQKLCDHAWMDCAAEMSNLGLQRGDYVKFRARVKRYQDRNGLTGLHKLKKIELGGESNASTK